ncbi:MAG: hypothetical protein MUC99_11920 [Anaerolineae bacterium]|nr:hypothetical protein [Anaerolineae bacterium]
MQDSSIDIKGTRDGLLIIIHPDSEWQQAIRELTDRIDKQASFSRASRSTSATAQCRRRRSAP